MMTVKEARIHIQLLRLKGQILEMRCGLCEIETRINNNHNPKTGRFTSGKGVDISGENGIIKATPQQRQQIKQKLSGTKTANGTVIIEVSKHAADRMIQRGLDSNMAKYSDIFFVY